MMEGAETALDRQALVDIKGLMDFFLFFLVYTVEKKTEEKQPARM